MYSVSHDSHDSLGQVDFYSSPNPKVLIYKKINKGNTKFDCMLDIVDKTPEIEERIFQVMTQLKTYKVITII